MEDTRPPFAEAMQAVGIVACAPVINLSPMFPYKPIDSLCQGRRGWNPFLGLLLVLFEVNSPPPHISLGKVTKHRCLVVEWYLE